MKNYTENEPYLKTERLMLNLLDPAYANLLKMYLEINREYFEKYVVMPDVIDDSYCIRSLWLDFEDFHLGNSVHLFLFMDEGSIDKKIIGDIFVSNIKPHPLSSCEIGFKISPEFSGKGFMAEALIETVNYLFLVRKIHRIEANIQHSNQKAAKLLRTCGFEEEGIVKDYLYLNNSWHNHIRYSIINEK